ncbi:TMV resistance protein N-like [Camellia sinensis]|uniref:TMV resistance protein N-like n=1 Tax=Camellia sinensis TaxID=4442 RepID=UPI001035F238|nr:TMV resistance protein N-like [Camellia sinensis]
MGSMKGQECSSSNISTTYHVFLSFRGQDTRNAFTDHLYTSLVQAGFRTFKDDDDIERGENIKLELHKAIRVSRISVVVFSKEYASSRWCLDELLMILECKRTSKHMVLPVFYDVDPSQVKNQTGSFAEAFARHENIEAESDEIKNEWMHKVKEWRAALREFADLGGMVLQNQVDGRESKFIQKIVKVIEDKLNRKILSDAPSLIGMYSRVTSINSWLQDESTNAGVLVICGMGGIGKTTIAKFVYNLNYRRFESSSFLANIKEVSEQPNGLVRLQRQLLSDISKWKKENIHNVDEGNIKIMEAMSCKRVLIVLDDVVQLDQLDAVIGTQDWLHPGSRIMITTRHERLMQAHKAHEVYKVENFDEAESFELFSWHAFGQDHPMEGFIEHSKRVIQYCGGLPLALQVLGSSLSGKSAHVWESALEKLDAIPESQIVKKLKISYDSLQDDHDKNLFLHIACFFVGKDKDCLIRILDECDFYTTIGIQNLIDRCLVTVDKSNKLMMHQLLRDMEEKLFSPMGIAVEELGNVRDYWHS